VNQVQDAIARWLAAVGENTYLAAVRNGMVAVVPLTILGGLFTVLTNLPIAGWEARIAPVAGLLQIPVTATFGLLGVFVSLAIGYDLGKRLGQEPIVSASLALLTFLLVQLQVKDQALAMDGLGSKGLFTAIVVALVAVRVQKLLADERLVIRLPAQVPQVVADSFLSLVPMVVLVVLFWGVRFVLNVDLNSGVQAAFSPLVFALNTLPGILVYALLVTLLWSVGVNGDNAMDALVAPVFLQYLAANVEAAARGETLPYITALGFFTSFVNVGGTGATLGLALVLTVSKDAAFRQVSRISLPTQVFGINEPIFFGLPIVLNPILMVPYILNALLLTASTFLLMEWGMIQRPLVNVPWTTPPVIGHYLVSGGDWRAAVWGVVSIAVAMLVYYPFAKAAAAQRASTRPGAAVR
jgi:PTS system cellobiose-specific IIC component